MRYSDITENNDDMFAGPSMVKLLAKAIAHDYADDDFDFYSLRDRYEFLEFIGDAGYEDEGHPVTNGLSSYLNGLNDAELDQFMKAVGNEYQVLTHREDEDDYDEDDELDEETDDMFAKPGNINANAKYHLRKLNDPYLEVVRTARKIAKEKFGAKTSVSSSKSRGRATMLFGDGYQGSPESMAIGQGVKDELWKLGLQSHFTEAGWLSVSVPSDYRQKLDEESDDDLFAADRKPEIASKIGTCLEHYMQRFEDEREEYEDNGFDVDLAINQLMSPYRLFIQGKLVDGLKELVIPMQPGILNQIAMDLADFEDIDLQELFNNYLRRGIDEDADDDMFREHNVLDRIEHLLRRKQKIVSKILGAMGEIVDVHNGAIGLKPIGRPYSKKRYSWGPFSPEKLADFYIKPTTDGKHWLLRSRENDKWLEQAGKEEAEYRASQQGLNEDNDLVSDVPDDDLFATSRRVWQVYLWMNKWDGRYYDFSPYSVEVPGATPADALRWMNSHKELVLHWLDNFRIGGPSSSRKRRLVRSPAAKNVFFDSMRVNKEMPEGTPLSRPARPGYTINEEDEMFAPNPKADIALHMSECIEWLIDKIQDDPDEWKDAGQSIEELTVVEKALGYGALVPGLKALDCISDQNVLEQLDVDLYHHFQISLGEIEAKYLGILDESAADDDMFGPRRHAKLTSINTEQLQQFYVHFTNDSRDEYAEKHRKMRDQIELELARRGAPIPHVDINENDDVDDDELFGAAPEQTPERAKAMWKMSYPYNKRYGGELISDYGNAQELGLEFTELFNSSGSSAQYRASWGTRAYVSPDGSRSIFEEHDSGGGSFTYIGTRIRKDLEVFVQELIGLGRVENPDARRQRVAAKAASRMGTINSKGIKIGSRLPIPSFGGVKLTAEVIAFTPGGKLKLRMLDGENPGYEFIASAHSFKRADVMNESDDHELFAPGRLSVDKVKSLIDSGQHVTVVNSTGKKFNVYGYGPTTSPDRLWLHVSEDRRSSVDFEEGKFAIHSGIRNGRKEFVIIDKTVLDEDTDEDLFGNTINLTVKKIATELAHYGGLYSADVAMDPNVIPRVLGEQNPMLKKYWDSLSEDDKDDVAGLVADELTNQVGDGWEPDDIYESEDDDMFGPSDIDLFGGRSPYKAVQKLLRDPANVIEMRFMKGQYAVNQCIGAQDLDGHPYLFGKSLKNPNSKARLSWPWSKNMELSTRVVELGPHHYAIVLKSTTLRRNNKYQGLPKLAEEDHESDEELFGTDQLSRQLSKWFKNEAEVAWEHHREWAEDETYARQQVADEWEGWALQVDPDAHDSGYSESAYQFEHIANEFNKSKRLGLTAVVQTLDSDRYEEVVADLEQDTGISIPDMLTQYGISTVNEEISDNDMFSEFPADSTRRNITKALKHQLEINQRWADDDDYPGQERHKELVYVIRRFINNMSHLTTEEILTKLKDYQDSPYYPWAGPALDTVRELEGGLNESDDLFGAPRANATYKPPHDWDSAWAQLVPHSGSSNTVEGECLRAAGKIKHDWYNNGFGNNWSGALNYLETYLPGGRLRSQYQVLEKYARGNARGADENEDNIELAIELICQGALAFALEAYHAHTSAGLHPNTTDMYEMQDENEHSWDDEEEEDYGEDEDDYEGYNDDEEDLEESDEELFADSKRARLSKALHVYALRMLHEPEEWAVYSPDDEDYEDDIEEVQEQGEEILEVSNIMRVQGVDPGMKAFARVATHHEWMWDRIVTEINEVTGIDMNQLITWD